MTTYIDMIEWLAPKTITLGFEGITMAMNVGDAMKGKEMCSQRKRKKDTEREEWAEFQSQINLGNPSLRRKSPTPVGAYYLQG